ncbi:MAG TPA: D-glycero-beta-D-manno-heptose 1-phosphate adenylyltransferase [Mycobacteriales bacterium]|nr:D-glycero-beta-D-manno-heptose 1-phosphate adenylyltransferase [Mycobacteriales bacterium]
MSPARRGGVLVVVGDALLDRDLVGRVDRLAPDAPVPVVDDLSQHARPGGAGLAALLAAADGREVVLVTALGGDEAGLELRALLDRAGIAVVDLGLHGPTPQKLRVRCDDRSLLRLDAGGREPARVGGATAQAIAALRRAAAVLVADYGRGVAADERLRSALTRLPHRTPVVWDPHVRGPQPVSRITLATPNAAEARALAGEPPGVVAGEGLAAVTARARELRERWSATGVSVTLGARGALLVGGDGYPLVVPAPPVLALDACGAGDRFASAAAGLLADGALPSEAVAGAVAAASAFVAAGGAAAVRVERARAAPPPAATGGVTGAVAGGRRPVPTPAEVVTAARAAGGTVVATGGCFDLLHAGHVALLEAARRLGDCLVVCLNSDASVRRLKGPGRPLTPEPDRAAVLRALGCVDTVVVFDEDTPEAVLERIQPDIWAKGGDYAVGDLPEARILRRWGGQTVILPYLQGRSTTALMKEAARRG